MVLIHRRALPMDKAMSLGTIRLHWELLSVKQIRVVFGNTSPMKWPRDSLAMLDDAIC